MQAPAKQARSWEGVLAIKDVLLQKLTGILFH